MAVSVWERAEAELHGEGPLESDVLRTGCGKGLGRTASSISISIIPGVCGASESVVGDGVAEMAGWTAFGCGCKCGGVEVAKCDVAIAGVIPETDDERGMSGCFWKEGPLGTDWPPLPPPATRTCDSS